MSDFAEKLGREIFKHQMTKGELHEANIKVEHLKQKLKELEYELNNSKSFHCPNFLTNDSGYVSCQVKEYDYNSYESLLKEAIDVIEELNGIVTGHIEEGDRLDCFTLQPTRQFLAKVKKEGENDSIET